MTSDAELISRSLAGDGQAFMEVISRHEVAVGAYLTRRVGREAALGGFARRDPGPLARGHGVSDCAEVRWRSNCAAAAS